MNAIHARRLGAAELHLLRLACDTVEVARHLLGTAPALPGTVGTSRVGVSVVKDAEGITIGPERATLSWARVAEHARLLTPEERAELAEELRALGKLDHTYPTGLPDAIARQAGIRLLGNGVAPEDREAYRRLEAQWREPALARFNDAKAEITARLEVATTACLEQPASRGAGGAPEEVALFDLGGLWTAPDPTPVAVVTTVDNPPTAFPAAEDGSAPWGPA